MTSFDHRRASRLPKDTKQSEYFQVFVRPVDEADVVEVKSLCEQPAVKTVVVEERDPWHQRVPVDAGPAPAEGHAEARSLGVIAASSAPDVTSIHIVAAAM